jgi:hypothetical protein
MRLSIAAVGTLCVAGGLLCQTAHTGPRQERLRADPNFLISEALAGRASLSPQAEIAARYIASAFQSAVCVDRTP